MIISVNELKRNPKFAEYDGEVLEMELRAIENAIRRHTNNNFQDQSVRIVCSSSGGVLQGASPYLKVGDTVEVSRSHNKGLYVITAVGETITLDKPLYDEPYNMVTRVRYDEDIIAGAVRMLEWKLTQSGKVGVQSESISRHSVTYFNMDGDNSIMGYPKSLLGFLKPYKCARF
ncbi:MAG: hypothetical protein IIX02_04095 [Clostridia bacterium]|nr:hypothetical protein [Clostridia bacterium]